MAISKQVFDELLGDRDPNAGFSKDGLLGDLNKALAERILNSLRRAVSRFVGSPLSVAKRFLWKPFFSG